METSDRSPLKSFLYGILTGAAVGAATALLFAPKSGKELRKDISETAERIGERTLDIGRSTGSAAQSLARKSTSWASDIRERLSKIRSQDGAALASEESKTNE